MNGKAKTRTGGGSADTLKLGLALLILVAGVVGFYWFGAQPQWIRVLGLLVTAGIAVAVASQTEKGAALLGFLRDANTELRKVVWPTRQETIQTTLMVVVVVIITGIMLWLMDMFFAWSIRTLVA